MCPVKVLYLYLSKYWNALSFLSPGDLPNPGMESGSPTLWAEPLPSGPPGKPHLSEGIRRLWLGANLAHTPFLQIKFYGNTVLPLQLHIVYG